MVISFHLLNAVSSTKASLSVPVYPFKILFAKWDPKCQNASSLWWECWDFPWGVGDFLHAPKQWQTAPPPAFGGHWHIMFVPLRYSFTIVTYLLMFLALYRTVGSWRSGVKCKYLCRSEGLSKHLWTIPRTLPDTLCLGSSNSGIYTGRGQDMQACKPFVCSSTQLPADGNSHLPSFQDSCYLFPAKGPICREVHSMSLYWESTWDPGSHTGTGGGRQRRDMRKGRLGSVFRGYSSGIGGLGRVGRKCTQSN